MNVPQLRKFDLELLLSSETRVACRARRCSSFVNGEFLLRCGQIARQVLDTFLEMFSRHFGDDELFSGRLVLSRLV
jgi:hypothetical protein